jgi:hypothetical protein
MRRTLALLVLLALSTSAFPQAAPEVQRLAPQLVTFAGGQANFDSLVNGLASGTRISLTTLLPSGGKQVVNFTPSGTMTAVQIAQTLENVRQSLITRGIAAPTGQQIAAAIVGAPLTTTTNASTAVQQSPAVSIQNTFGQGAAGASTDIRSQMSDSPFPRGISDTPPAPTSTPAPIALPQSTAPLRTR